MSSKALAARQAGLAAKEPLSGLDRSVTESASLRGLRPGEVSLSSCQPLAEPVRVDQYPSADPHHASIKPGLSTPPDLPAETAFGKEMREFIAKLANRSEAFQTWKPVWCV
jgi:hypothetical protein